MAQESGSATPEAGEQSSLLGEQRNIKVDDASSETLTGSQGADEEELVDPDRANQQVGRGRGMLIVLSLWGLIFLQAANMSGITTTQSKIAEDLDAFAAASWFTSAYLIAASSISPLSARLAQVFSPRVCVLVSSVFFALGGLIASQAQDLTGFLAGRAVQGLGGAGIMTISFILVLELAGKKRRGLYIGLVNTGFTIGVSFGAVVAGALLPVTGWRFLFWIQCPLALAFGTGIFFSIPKHFTSGQKDDGASIMRKLARIDYLGALMLIATISLFLFGLSSQHVLWIPIVVSFVLLIFFVCIELYIASDPIIPISVLKSRGALLSCVAQLGIMAARWSVLFYTPAYAIAIRGWSPASAGSILLPTNFGFAIGGILAGGLHIKRSGSFWLPSIVSYSLFACALALISQISNQDTPTLLYFLAVFVNGLCIGSALNYTLAHLLHLTPPSTHFISTSLLTTFRGFAGSFGSAIGGGLFVRVLKAKLEQGFEEHGDLEGNEDLIRRLLGSPALVKELVGFEKQIAIDSYVGGLKALFVAGVGLAVLMVVVQAFTGWKEPVEVKGENEANGNEVENGLLGVEDEEWEEGMEQGV
ncbi:MFS general substrate transporter [Mollisia scopiformis]|uniref:MFS general substrate transporter n=1 Tax=Mollisia scopiformis TaxID=149040 RepID=A0A194WV37_MOLSC|nr:MFS general substrate transporter [Mollisia scopiformis]KUJ11835.1 MFS general substrate transporter [Mollisia scopiformis]